MYFTISLEANQGAEGFGQFTTLTYAQSPGVPLNTWTHLVATYDQETVSLFVNGVPVASIAACDSPPCGKIVYPSRLSPGGDCRYDEKLHPTARGLATRNQQECSWWGEASMVLRCDSGLVRIQTPREANMVSSFEGNQSQHPIFLCPARRLDISFWGRRFAGPGGRR